jgi:hypothetical protein
MTTNFSSATVDLAEPVFSEQERPALAGFPVGDSGLAGEAAPGVLPRQRGRLADLGGASPAGGGCRSYRLRIICMIDAAVFHTQNRVSNVVWMVILPWVVVIGSVIYYPTREHSC